MIVKKLEYRDVTSTIDYDIPEEDIIKEFGSVDAFIKAESNELESKFFQFIILPKYYRGRSDVWSDNITGTYDFEYSFENEE